MAVQSFALFDVTTGLPLTTATPSFALFRSVDGIDRTPPAAPAHIGGGVYTFTVTQADEDAGTVALILSDGGGQASSKYQVFSFHPQERPIHAFAFFNPDGTLWTGASPPTIGHYDDLQGNPETPPALLAVSAPAIYALRLSEAEFLDGGRAYRIDAVAGAVPAYYSGSIDGTITTTNGATEFDTDWSEFEDLIQAQVKAATGLDGAHVIWANQTRDRPSRPFVELAVIGHEPVSDSAEVFVEDNPVPVAGQEILLVSTDVTEVTVQMRVYSKAVTGNTKAIYIARRISHYFGSEACTDALGDVAVVKRNPVRDVSMVLETEHEGRAVLDIRFRVADRSALPTTYIETVPVETTVTPPGDANIVVVTLEE